MVSNVHNAVIRESGVNLSERETKLYAHWKSKLDNRHLGNFPQWLSSDTFTMYMIPCVGVKPWIMLRWMLYNGCDVFQISEVLYIKASIHRKGGGGRGALNIKISSYQYRVITIKIRRFYERLILIMGIPIPGKMVFTLRQGPQP